MSVSENSTLFALSRDNDGISQLSSVHTYGLGDRAVNAYAKSPYIDTKLFILEVGPNKTSFPVHRLVLSQSPELEVKPSSKLWGDTAVDSIALPDLDEATAHTLVHYLYSGRYQTLESFNENALSVKANSVAVSGYKNDTCVYCAAIRYKLPGLADLAKKNITSFSDKLEILDILKVAREHAFPNLPSDELWFPAYLEDVIKVAVLQDPELGTSPEFIDQIEGDKRFKQVVFQAIVNSYSSRPSARSERNTGLSTPAAEDFQSELSPVDEIPSQAPQTAPVSEKVKTIADDNAKQDQVKEAELAVKSPQHVPEAAVVQDLPVTADVKQSASDIVAKQPPTTDIATSVDDLKLDEIDPTPPAAAELEPFTDELGFKSSKTYQQINGKAEKSSDLEGDKLSKPKRISHERSDSVIGPSSSDTTNVQDSLEKPVDPPAPVTETSKPAAVLSESVDQETKVASKKNKKKKKKNATTTVTA